MKSLAPRALASNLRKTPAGETLTEAEIRADIEAGAPTDSRGRVLLAAYLAWLLRRHEYPGQKSEAGQ